MNNHRTQENQQNHSRPAAEPDENVHEGGARLSPPPFQFKTLNNSVVGEQSTDEAIEQQAVQGVRQYATGDAEHDAGENEHATGDNEVMYELIAHGFAYVTQFSPEQQDMLRAWGYIPQWTDMADDQEDSGFFGGLLEPSLEGRAMGRKPIVAFRGSEMGNQFIKDWLYSDGDSYAVGYTGFMKNALQVQRLLEAANAHGKAVVTGHSLGGSIAKQAVILFPNLIDSCVTFQAPGINAEQTEIMRERMNNGEYVPDVRTHTSEGDIVHLAGDGRMPNAESSHHDPSGILEGNTPLAHTLYLLSSSEYQTEQNQLLSLMPPGTTWEQLLSDASGINEQNGKANKAEPISVDAPAQPLTTTFYETIESIRRETIGHNLHPGANIVNESTSGDIQNMPLIGRINIMREFMHEPSSVELFLVSALAGGVVGIVGGGLAIYIEYNDWKNTRQAIMHILNSSNAQDTVAIIDAIGGMGAMSDRLGWGYQDGFQDMLKGANGYYEGLTIPQAAALIHANLESSFFSFEEDKELIIADILTYTPNGEGVLAAVGEGDYDEGLERVLRFLDFTEDRRVSARYKFKNRERGWTW